MDQINYLRINELLEPEPVPTWRDDENIDPEIFKVLEVLYYYITTQGMSIEEKSEYYDIIKEVSNCKDFSEIEELDIQDYFEPAYDHYKKEYSV